MDTNSITNEQAAKLTAAAITEATRLCDQAMAALSRLDAWAKKDRARRYQIDEFRTASARVERVVFDLLRVCPDGPADVATRGALLDAIDTYCNAGLAEIERRFSAVEAA